MLYHIKGNLANLICIRLPWFLDIKTWQYTISNIEMCDTLKSSFLKICVIFSCAKMSNCPFYHCSWTNESLFLWIRLRSHLVVSHLYLPLRRTSNLWSWVRRNFLQGATSRRWGRRGRGSVRATHMIKYSSGWFEQKTWSKQRQPD